MIATILLIIASIIISIIQIVSIYLARHNFDTKLNIILNILVFLFMGVIFFTSFFLSTETYLPKNIVLILWYISIISWVFSISLLSINHKFVIKFEEKVILLIILYSFIIGIILGLLFLSDSFKISLNRNYYRFIFQNLLLLFFLLSFNLIIFGGMCYNLIKNFSSIRDKRSKEILTILTFQFCLIIFLYSIYIITQNIIFKNIYIAIYLMGAFFTSYTLIKNPSLLIELTNRIYDFIIFHRSGILLYSYNFETGEETDESLIKGSILIGINHILSNFIDKKDQLNLIKMKNRQIILEYDTNHGYALLLTVNHKNSFIDNAVTSFMKKFTSLNKEKLKKLSGLIDISEFRNAKGILSEFFEPFIIKN